MSESRKRGPNFTIDEKMLLLNLVTKYKDVLENKKTNASIWKQKEEVWQKIEEEFNSSKPSCVFRNVESLKSAYENKKKQARHISAEKNRARRRTGGGSPSAPVNDPTYQMTLNILNKKTVHGLNNPYDDDALSTSDQDNEMNDITSESKTKKPKLLPMTETKNLQHHVFIDEDITEDENNVTNTKNKTQNKEFEKITENRNSSRNPTNWKHYNPEYLKNPVSKKSQVKNLPNTSNCSTTNTWTSRRRQELSATGNVAKINEDLGQVKCTVTEIHLEMLQAEKANQAKKFAREDEEREAKMKEYQLKARSFQLEIELKEQQIEALQKM